MRCAGFFPWWTAVILLATSAGLAQVPASQPAGQLHLLVVGVDAADEIYKSNSPTPSLYGQDVLGQDAREFSKSLGQSNITDLHTLVNQDLTEGAGTAQSPFDQAFDRFQTQLGPTDTLMVVVSALFYRTGQGDLMLNFGQYGHDIFLAHLLARLRHLPCPNAILVFPGGMNPAMTQLISKYISDFPAAAGGSNLQIVISPTLLLSGKHTPLLQALSEGLRGDADNNHDGLITTGELQSYLEHKATASMPDAVARMEPGFTDNQSWTVSVTAPTREFIVLSREEQARAAGEPASDATSAPGRQTLRGSSLEVAGAKGKPALEFPKTYAVLFATDHYQHWPALTNPIDDAKALQATLRDTYQVETELVADPTASDVLTVLRRYIARSYDDNAQLIVFFAGHGYFDDVPGIGFLAMRDSELPAADVTRRSLLSFDEVQRYVTRIPAKHILLIIDSCFAGTFDRRIADNGTRDQGGDRIYAPRPLAQVIGMQMSYPTRRFITSGGKEYVPDGRPGEHSPFSRALLQTLNKNADEHGYTRWRDLQMGLEQVNPAPRWGSFGDTDDLNGDLILLTPAMRDKLQAAGTGTQTSTPSN
jgi:Caspase domain